MRILFECSMSCAFYTGPFMPPRLGALRMLHTYIPITNGKYSGGICE